MHYLPAYGAYFRSQARYAVLYGGAGSGKSVTAAQKVILQCLLYPGASILCIRKYRTSLRHSVFALLKSQINLTGRSDQTEISVTNLTINFPNGSQIRCLGLDDPEKIKSIQGITSVWVEEATELREEDFSQLELRVRGHTPGYKQFTLTFNPIDQSHWLHTRFFQQVPPSDGEKPTAQRRVAVGEGDVASTRALDNEDQIPPSKGDSPLEQSEGERRAGGCGTSSQETTLTPPPSNLFLLHTTYRHNTELDQAYLDHLNQALRQDDNLYRVYTLGQWGHLRRGGEFYKSFSMATHVRVCTYHDTLPIHISFDFNLHPYITATIWQITQKIVSPLTPLPVREGLGVGPDNKYQALQLAEFCLKSPQNTTTALCKAILSAYPNHSAGAFIYGDPTGSHASPLTDARTTHYHIIRRELAAWQPTQRVAQSAPSVPQRAIFINAILANQVESLSITIDPTCTNTIQDYQNLQEAPDGTKLKTQSTDPATGIRSQPLGHTSDANDYFLTQAFQTQYRTHNRGHRTLPPPLFGTR